MFYWFAARASPVAGCWDCRADSSMLARLEKRLCIGKSSRKSICECPIWFISFPCLTSIISKASRRPCSIIFIQANYSTSTMPRPMRKSIPWCRCGWRHWILTRSRFPPIGRPCNVSSIRGKSGIRNPVSHILMACADGHGLFHFLAQSTLTSMTIVSTYTK